MNSTGGEIRLPSGGVLDPELRARMARVRMFLSDVDGVLTDASVFIGGQAEVKRFNIRDGLGLRLLHRQGIKVGWISNRYSEATTRRAQELGVDYLRQEEYDKGPGMKVKTVETLLKEVGYSWEDVAFVGDDIADLGPMMRAGVAVAVADAIEEVRAVADYVTHAPGGGGAVREAIEMILRAQGHWERLVESYAD